LFIVWFISIPLDQKHAAPATPEIGQNGRPTGTSREAANFAVVVPFIFSGRDFGPP
jgi:hypothetical protein